jgi:hypothetical protein
VIELLAILLGWSEGIILFWMVIILAGGADELRLEGNWKEVLYAVFVFSLSVVVMQLLVIGILWIAQYSRLTEQIYFQNPLYTWGFRLLELWIRCMTR